MQITRKQKKPFRAHFRHDVFQQLHAAHDTMLFFFCFVSLVHPFAVSLKNPLKMAFIQNDLSDSGCANLNGDWLTGWIIYKQDKNIFVRWKCPTRMGREKVANIMNGATNWTGMKRSHQCGFVVMAYALEENETCNIRNKRAHHNKILDW